MIDGQIIMGSCERMSTHLHKSVLAKIEGEQWENVLDMKRRRKTCNELAFHYTIIIYEIT